ncbi:MAG: hypothetical protein WC882_00430 [Candidatus Gracilibacteria bacterium]
MPDLPPPIPNDADTKKTAPQPNEGSAAMDPDEALGRELMAEIGERDPWDFILSHLNETAESPLNANSFRERIERVEWPSYVRALIPVLADFLTHQEGATGLTAIALKERIEHSLGGEEACAPVLDDLMSKIELFHHLQGQTGREIRRELNGVEPFIGYALPGMIVTEFLEEKIRFEDFIRGIGSGRRMMAADIAKPPLSEELKTLSQSPEALYERVLQEHLVCRMQAARTQQWGNGAVETLRKNPGQFLEGWLRMGAVPSKIGTALPRFLREGNLVGLPEYDVSIRVLSSLNANERKNLLSAIDRTKDCVRGKDMETQKKRLDELKKSLQKLEESPESVFPRDLMQVASARKIKIPKPGAVSAPMDRWMNLVGPLFRQAPKELGWAMLDTLGHIPEFPYTTSAFKKVPFENLVRFHNTSLRPAQQQGEPQETLCGTGPIYHEQRVLHARSQFLKHLFLSGAAESIKDASRQQVTIDIEGLRIDLPGTEAEEGSLHAHIPFAYVTNELWNYLVEKQWIPEEDAIEIRLRQAQGNNDVLALERWDHKKTVEFAFACDTGRRKSFSFENAIGYMTQRCMEDSACPGWDHAEICALLASSPSNSHVPQAIVHQGKRIPRSVLDYFLSEAEGLEGTGGRRHRIVQVLEIAEAVQSAISQEVTIGKGLVGLPLQIKEGMEARSSHRLSRTAKDSYEVRRRILLDPKFYDVAQMVGAVLARGVPSNSPESQFLVFRGDFGKSSGGLRHHFLEVVDGGKIVRILLSPDKHLNQEERLTFETLPKLERGDYERLEGFVMTYGHFHQQLKWLSWESISFDYDVKKVNFQEIAKLMLDLNAVILTEFPGDYSEVNQLYREFLQASPTEAGAIAKRHIACCERLDRLYAGRLFSAQDPKQVLDSLSVDIQREEVVFDEHFMEQFPPEVFKEWSFDKDLARCGEKTWVVHAGDRSIPFAMESKAIRALDLISGRPLISFAGGCKGTGYDETQETPSLKMARAIVRVAHNCGANVAPPGTQSGFGADMSKAFLEYQREFSHLPKSQRAECFAVSPGGETYYPGNPWLKTHSEESELGQKVYEPYAMIPFKSILTPCAAGWDWHGPVRRTAPYFDHVEYMELIYQRLAEGAPRVLVVGNGGLFTIVESIAAMKNNVPLILTRDTGMFTDFMITVLAHFNQWELLSQPEHRDELDREMINILKTQVPEEYRSAIIKKGFGEAVPPDETTTQGVDQKLYRDYFYQFLQLAKTSRIRVSGIDDLEKNLEEMVAPPQPSA